jgi:hypothetical protein
MIIFMTLQPFPDKKPPMPPNRKPCWIPILVSLLVGCQAYDKSAHFVLANRSDHPIYYYVTCDSAFKDFFMGHDYILKPHDSVMPYLLYGPEGKGPNKSTWINAINRADDSALHVFLYYIDYKNDADLTDSVYRLIIHRYDLRVDSLVKLNWRLECH